MARVIVGMTISLDGFVNDRDGGVAALYHDLDALRNTEPLRKSIANTGAVVMGRNAFAMAADPDSFAGNYEYQVPIFVLTHEPPRRHPKETDTLTFTFVTDGIASAIRQAREAAGARDVTVIGGAMTAEQCINAGLADELHLDIMPVLFGRGGGRRLFEQMGTDQIQLERIQAVELPSGRTHLELRVIRTQT